MLNDQFNRPDTKIFGTRRRVALPLTILTLLTAAFSIDAAAQTASGPRFVAPKIPGSGSKNAAAAAGSEKNAEIPELPAESPTDGGLLLGEPENDVENASNATKLELAPLSDDETLGAESEIDATQAENTTLNLEETENSTQKADNSVERAPYDPIKENGEYFKGWEKPDVALVFTGMTNGYIEPCGCAGMDRMKGGLSRRCEFLRGMREDLGWDVVAIDAGQITVGFGVQEELKFDMASNAFRLMEYDAIGIGKGELRFPAYFLLTFTAPTSAETPSPFTSANVGVYSFNSMYALPFKIVERGGKRIGVVSVVCPSEEIERRDENLLIESPEKKLKEIAPALAKAACDRLVLIVHGTEAETNALAKKFPTFDFVVTADSPSEPPAELKPIDGTAKKRDGAPQHLIEVGEKGKFAVVLGLYGDDEIRYQRVALDSRYESSVEISLLMKDYQSILKTLISTKGYRAGLGISPVRSPKADVLGKYVGAKKCQSCHEESYRVWLRSRHAVAWKSLTDVAKPPRDFDPECVGCHVDGWEGIQCFPYVDGFVTAEETPELLNVGCESCHGPGERHIAAELDGDEETQETIRAAMRLGGSTEKVCYSCHDGDNSPEFDFSKYYPLIEHAEDDGEEDEE